MVLKPKVLIVDDEPLNVKLLASMLSADEYDTISSYSGKDALEKVKNLAPDLILLDIMMAGLNGYEITRIIKSDPERLDIPIILITAFGGTDSQIEGIEAGADEFLNKPVNKTELLARVRSLLRLKQYQDQLKARIFSINSFTEANDDNKLSYDNTGIPSILIAEDNEKDTKLIQHFLNGEPYQIKLARDGEETLSLVGRDRVDIILLDIILPQINGFDVCKTLKSTEGTKNIQIVAITNLSDLDSKIKGIDLGVDDYLVKPVNSYELRTRIKSLVKKKAYLDDLYVKYERALHSAITDKLTKLYSRSYFDHFLELEIKRSNRQKTPIALLMIDVDNFKQINDNFGHLAGDELLQRLGEQIRTNIREIDLAARYGGEEFAVVMPNADLRAAKLVAERIRRAIYEYSVVRCPSSVTVSIGIALYPSCAKSMHELIEIADTSLYKAKQKGKNQICTPVYKS